ncbi:hypothetical protein [Shimia aestuarii]|uniref:hypothetical protein n=1 Tax=Shimia aestuarii TaxID=254406 RepID=UPI001FB1BB4C|nr:hypothetical protein [Shimia aestuarii]
MKMNSQIPMMGHQPDIMGQMQKGFTLGRQNALSNIYREHGAGIASGDQNSLNALAQFDPMAAQTAQANRQTMDHAAENMARLSRAEQRQVEAHAAQMSAAKRVQEAKRIEQAVAMGLAAQTPEQWDALVSSRGASDLVGQFENRDAIANRFLSVAEVLKRQDGPKQSAAEAKITRFMQEFQVDRPTATKMADGLIKVHRDPITGETSLLDVTTGGQWQGVAGIEEPNPSPAPSPEVSQFQDVGAPNPDIAGAFGVEGLIKRGVNAVADSAGLDVPFDVEATAQSEFAVLHEQLLSDIANGYKRQPPSWLLKRIDELAPSAGTLQGVDTAKRKLEALSASFSEELADLERRSRRKMSPNARVELEAQIEGLQAALGRTDRALAKLGGDQSRKQTATGIKWSIEQ